MRRFSWDEAKRRKVWEERGIDLVALAAIFRTPEDLMIRLDGRTEYGEHRFQAIGRIGSDYFFLAYAKRTGVRHLITGWKLSDAGKRRYQNLLRRRH